jgi:peptidoglycan/xylan/chitin deacetylase (PgdA/CDA1 family)
MDATSLAKQLVRGVLSRGPAYAWARSRTLRQGAVTMLMYHTLGRDHEPFDAWTIVRRGDFLRQMDWLRRHYEVVTLTEALDGARVWPRPPAVVTFDDGEAGMHDHLLPIVEAQQLPVTVYVATGQIECGRPYWFDRAMNAAQLSEPTPLALTGLGLPALMLGTGHGARSWATVGALLAALKRLAPTAREAATAAVEQALQGRPRRLVTPLRPMRLDQLQELAASRWVTIGAHTHDHSLLDELPLADAERSIVTSRERLREWTGREIAHFAYPNGNHDAVLVAAVERLGFASAVTTVKGFWRPGQGRYDIRRIPVGRWDDLDRFRIELLGGVRAAWGPRDAAAPAARFSGVMT